MCVLSDDQTRFQNALTERSVELALKATRKMFPALARREGLVEIEALLADCLQEAKAESKIMVQVSDAMAEPFRERIDALVAKAGYQGIVTVLADDTLGPADCRVEWADGGAERVAQHMWQEFDAATQRVFADSEDDTMLEPPADPPVAEADPGLATPAPDTPDLITDPPAGQIEPPAAEPIAEPAAGPIAEPAAGPRA
jgi:flagellar assembly protein FliH